MNGIDSNFSTYNENTIVSYSDYYSEIEIANVLLADLILKNIFLIFLSMFCRHIH